MDPQQDPIKLAREALNEALIKQENDRTLWVPEWQYWANDARTALAALAAAQTEEAESEV